MFPKVPLRSVLRKVEEPVVIQPEKTYKQVTVRLFHKGVVLRGQQAGADIRTARQWGIRGGQILLSRIDARNGAIGLVPFDLDGAVVTNDFWAFEVDSRAAEPGFLDAYFGTPEFVEACRRASEGTTNRVRLQLERFLDIAVPLPSLTEQRRIVTRIEEFSTKIEEARRLRRETSAKSEAVATAAGQRCLAQTNVVPTALRSWLNPNRDGIQTGPFGAQLNSGDFVESGVPVLSIGNVQHDGLSLHELKYVSPEKAEDLGRFRIQTGDILFARMGTVGRCCIVPEEAKGWLINYHIIRVALDKTRVEPRYIYWTIRASAEVDDYLKEKVRGATREGVNSAIVAELPCRIPSLADQRRIVAYLDSLEQGTNTLRRCQSKTAAELDALLPSILDKAFKGEL